MEQSHILNLMFALGTTAPVLTTGLYLEEAVDADILDGDTNVTNDQNMVVDATTVLTDPRVAQTGIKFIHRQGTKLIQSDMIKAEDVINVTGSLVVAAVEQVTYIGYTGSANSISVINDNVYKLNLQFDTLGRTGRGNSWSVDIMYKSDAAATQTSVAFGILANLVPSLKAQAEPTVTVRLINSAALVANDRFTSTVATVKGSKFLTFSANFVTTSGLTMAVGDLIRIGSATDDADAAVALGSTVYKVVTLVSATVVELDRPFTGTTVAANTASTDTSLIPAANVGNYGIRITGVAPTWTLGKRPWSKVTFKVALTDFGSTVVTYTTAATLGRGGVQQIKDLEWFTNGEGGEKYRGDYMYQGYTSQASTATTFRQLCITWANDSRSESIGGPGHNPKQLILAMEAGPAIPDNNDQSDILYDVVTAYTGITTSIGW